jgi:putative aldouronate transport system permease protein
MIDGASRLQRIWHISLPGITPMIVIQLILTIGGLLGSDFEKVLLLQNPSIMERADVLSTYTYRIGIRGGKFSLSSAVGLCGSVVNFILIITTNFICNKLGETSLW